MIMKLDKSLSGKTKKKNGMTLGMKERLLWWAVRTKEALEENAASICA